MVEERKIVPISYSELSDMLYEKALLDIIRRAWKSNDFDKYSYERLLNVMFSDVENETEELEEIKE